VSLAPCGASFGGGSLYIADQAAVRRVDPGTGRLTTPVGNGIGDPLGDRGLAAGGGTHGLGDGGPAVKAQPGLPGAVAADGEGNLVITDAGNERVRVVTG
jgi:hypothetical protein